MKHQVDKKSHKNIIYSFIIYNFISMFFIFCANCRIQEAGYWLAKTLDLQLVDDFGFSKRYTRSLQVHLDKLYLFSLETNVSFSTC